MQFEHKRRVIIVDDDSDFGFRAVQAFNQAGFHAYFHYGARGALETISQKACDVVLLDVNMPELDGPRLLRMLRDTFTMRLIRIVLCSNMHESALQKLALRFGADHALQKPEDIHQLINALQSFLLTDPPNRARTGAKISSVAPVSEVRVRRVSELPPLVVTIDSSISIEPPDLLVLDGRVRKAETRFDAVAEWIRSRPHYMVLLAMSETNELAAKTREQLGKWAKSKPPYAIAAFGADFHRQVVFETIHRAISRLGGRPLHRYFAGTEVAARVWLDEIRRNHHGHRQISMHDETNDEGLRSRRVG